MQIVELNKHEENHVNGGCDYPVVEPPSIPKGEPSFGLQEIVTPYQTPTAEHLPE